MDGVFGKQRFTKVYNIIGFISGVILVFLFGFFICAGGYVTLDDTIASWFFVCFGFFISILCGGSLYVNRKAYIHVDAQGISAFCHIGLSLKCGFSDVSSVSYGGTGLNIQLNNGKKYSLIHLENADSLGKYIQKRIPRQSQAVLDKNELIQAIPPLRKKRKYEGIGAVCAFLLLIPVILLTSALTGWKDLSEFTSGDWSVFAAMACVSVILIVLSCILLRRFLRHTDALNEKLDALSRILLQASPLRPGNALKMYVDDDFHPSIRLTVYGYPNSGEVYFTVEQVSKNFELVCIHESKVYSGMDALAPEIADMTEIPLPQES